MNKIKKNVTVRFFSIDATQSFFKNFVANYIVSYKSDLSSRIFTIKNNKYLVKTPFHDTEKFFLTVVKERNTWQVKATRDGSISSLALNQGMIGDPYYFCLLPNQKIIFGLTTGPIGSLKNVAKFVIEQFNSDRLSKLNLALIPKEKEYSKLLELTNYNSLHFKINSSSLMDISEDAPQLIRNLSAAPYIDNNIQLSLDLECSNEPDSQLTQESLVEIVNYLSESDSCSILKVKGIDKDGKKVNLDFGNAFVNYKTDMTTRNDHIDENTASKILNAAFDFYLSIN
ncbi:hypothetical protein [Acinetobacter radioresistens]|uniref:hypothetical protein n=1 Tax=Acinetobacter radioresistens TaxID=40216 RepID=UPI00224557FD|nr:hypothetical protein [Acinetobacter radioresistens]MCX0340172.1 hypothetical protein [Acinetobacter radioresistens]